ncbi:unnamed protein product [Rotaria sp. Silwood1]|nr:unnamed protein product [Rotaria sp. Silwood1]CAF4576915.1 unnamed protein product [Rotaria sp. Silwood1]
MKKIIIAFFLLATFNLKSQTIQLINSPDTGLGFKGSIYAINNKIVGIYTNKDLINQLGVYDGTNVTLIPNPDNGTVLTLTASGLGQDAVVYKNSFFCFYKTSTSDTVLLKFNGLNTSLITLSGYKPVKKYFDYFTSDNINPFFKVYNNKLFLCYQNKTTSKLHLAIYNDTALTIMSNPDNGSGLRGGYMVYSNNLYVGYNNDANSLQIAKVGTSNLQLLPNSISNGVNWQDFNNVGDIEMSGNSYIVITKSTNSCRYLARFNGNTINVVPRPSWSDSTMFGDRTYKIKFYKEFTTIGKVNAGNKEYSFIDAVSNLELGIRNWYYRLEIVDKDGSKQYSSVNSVQLKVNSEIKVYPNPAKDMVTIDCAGAKELLIIDCLGRTVYKSMVNSQWSMVNTKQFGKGVYVVKAVMSNGEVKTEKLVVE